MKLFVAGHAGMVGSALLRKAGQFGYDDLVSADHSDLDLTRQSDVEAFLDEHRPSTVVIAAAKVGGIYANESYPAEFLHQNLLIADNLINGAHLMDVSRVLFLGSSCIYPRMAPQPIRESALLTSELEPTNEAYAIAKIAGLKLCEFYRKQYGRLYHSAMPCNLFGPGDNYHPENSHVIPAMIRRFHEAKVNGLLSVTIWGTGTPLREFLHVDDLASACYHLLALEDPPSIANVGSGREISIIDLARLVAEVVGYEGEVLTDVTKPDGTPRKVLNIERISSSGWLPNIGLKEGLKTAYQDFLKGNVRSQ